MKKYFTHYRALSTTLVILVTFVGNLFANTSNPHYPPTRNKFVTPKGFNYKKLNKQHKRVYFWNKILGRKCHRM